MRIAMVSDIHGNLTALEAVLADLRQTSPDLILHGGDLAAGGSSPAEVVDRVRELGWSGVLGNTDEMLFCPESLVDFARQSPSLAPLLTPIAEQAAAARAALGEERLAWLRALPRRQQIGSVVLVHATPADLWRAPEPAAGDAEFASAYSILHASTVVYAHIHQPFVRTIPGWTVTNTGSTSLSYDGDPRASYLLLDDAVPSIRRVAYDREREIEALSTRRVPHAAWLARTLRSARPEMP